MASQIVRSSTSSGANYEEARSAASSMIATDLDDLIREANELTAILVASSRTARRNADTT